MRFLNSNVIKPGIVYSLAMMTPNSQLFLNSSATKWIKLPDGNKFGEDQFLASDLGYVNKILKSNLAILPIVADDDSCSFLIGKHNLRCIEPMVYYQQAPPLLDQEALLALLRQLEPNQDIQLELHALGDFRFKDQHYKPYREIDASTIWDFNSPPSLDFRPESDLMVEIWHQAVYAYYLHLDTGLTNFNFGYTRQTLPNDADHFLALIDQHIRREYPEQAE
jgi:hypothetical protein